MTSVHNREGRRPHVKSWFREHLDRGRNASHSASTLLRHVGGRRVVRWRRSGASWECTGPRGPTRPLGEPAEVLGRERDLPHGFGAPLSRLRGKELASRSADAAMASDAATRRSDRSRAGREPARGWAAAPAPAAVVTTVRRQRRPTPPRIRRRLRTGLVAEPVNRPSIRCCASCIRAPSYLR